jgi:hypothetical protein
MQLPYSGRAASLTPTRSSGFPGNYKYTTEMTIFENKFCGMIKQDKSFALSTFLQRSCYRRYEKIASYDSGNP